MATYLHPGVYLEEIPSGAKPIEGVATSIAAFIGEAARGPIGQPVLVHSLEEYERTFGGIHDEDDAMGFAAVAYYQNGGKDAYFVRVAKTAEALAAAYALRSAEATATGEVLSISASSVGEWGNDISFRIVDPDLSDATFTLEVGHMEKVEGVTRFKADLVHPRLSMDAGSPLYAFTQVNESSPLVRLTQLPMTEGGLQKGTLTGSGLPDAADHLKKELPDALSLTLNINGLGSKTLRLTKSSLALAGTSLKEDADKLAAALQKLVQDLSPSEADPYKDFTCLFNATTRHFVLSSDVSASSSVEVYDTGTSSLAHLLGLTPKRGAVRLHGARRLVPRATTDEEQALQLHGGRAPAPEESDFQAVFNGPLKKIRDISVVALPGQSMPTTGLGNPFITAALAHCEDMRNRVLIIDPPPAFELVSANAVDQLKLPTSTYSVFYYPRVKVLNPFHKPGNGKSPTVPVGPSAFAAGMWSRIDARRGVWKAPAGVETGLLGVAGLEFTVDDADQDQLNPLGVNCLRPLPNLGVVLWGARTLATRADPEWRYVSVRRTAILIEQSLYNGIQWAVFEPNDHRLWSALRVNIGSFMDGLFRAGAFQGERASDAYFVRCGLGDTMTQGDVDRGQVIVVVGFAPLKAAEFVIVRIQQKLQQ
jgi:hypothetical protein